MLIQENIWFALSLKETVHVKQDQAINGAMNLLQAQALDWVALTARTTSVFTTYAEMLVSYDQANVIGSKELRNHPPSLARFLCCFSLGEIDMQGRPH